MAEKVVRDIPRATKDNRNLIRVDSEVVDAGDRLKVPGSIIAFLVPRPRPGWRERDEQDNSQQNTQIHRFTSLTRIILTNAARKKRIRV